MKWQIWTLDKSSRRERSGESNHSFSCSPIQLDKSSRTQDFLWGLRCQVSRELYLWTRTVLSSQKCHSIRSEGHIGKNSSSRRCKILVEIQVHRHSRWSMYCGHLGELNTRTPLLVLPRECRDNHKKKVWFDYPAQSIHPMGGHWSLAVSEASTYTKTLGNYVACVDEFVRYLTWMMSSLAITMLSPPIRESSLR